MFHDSNPLASWGLTGARCPTPQTFAARLGRSKDLWTRQTTGLLLTLQSLLGPHARRNGTDSEHDQQMGELLAGRDGGAAAEQVAAWLGWWARTGPAALDCTQTAVDTLLWAVLGAPSYDDDDDDAADNDSLRWFRVMRSRDASDNLNVGAWNGVAPPEDAARRLNALLMGWTWGGQSLPPAVVQSMTAGPDAFSPPQQDSDDPDRPIVYVRDFSFVASTLATWVVADAQNLVPAIDPLLHGVLRDWIATVPTHFDPALQQAHHPDQRMAAGVAVLDRWALRRGAAAHAPISPHPDGRARPRTM